MKYVFWFLSKNKSMVKYVKEESSVPSLGLLKTYRQKFRVAKEVRSTLKKRKEEADRGYSSAEVAQFSRMIQSKSKRTSGMKILRDIVCLSFQGEGRFMIRKEPLFAKTFFEKMKEGFSKFGPQGLEDEFRGLFPRAPPLSEMPEWKEEYSKV